MAGRVHLDVPFGKAGEDHSGEVREVMLYTHPAPTQAPLSDEQIGALRVGAGMAGSAEALASVEGFARSIERACAAVWGVKLEDTKGKE
jgi:hypothetical protein